MPNKRLILLGLLLVFYAFAKAQEKDPSDTIIEATDVEQASVKEEYDPLRPAKAAFYAGVLPGLGQVYNRDYWKLPLVYGALGSSIYAVAFNSNKAEEFRSAFKDRLAGRIDEFTIVDEAGNPVLDANGNVQQIFDNDQLLRGQELYQRRRDLFVLISAGVYILQVIEANVDAHLSQYDVDDDLSFGPDLYYDDYGNTMNYGMKFTYRF